MEITKRKKYNSYSKRFHSHDGLSNCENSNNAYEYRELDRIHQA